jgi:hypothetical protein
MRSFAEPPVGNRTDDLLMTSGRHQRVESIGQRRPRLAKVGIAQAYFSPGAAGGTHARVVLTAPIT